MRILIINENSLKDINFNFGLSIEFWVVLYNLECNLFFLFVVEGLENLPKRSLTQGAKNFISVRDGVTSRYLNVTLVISKILNWWNSSHSRVVNFILLNFLQLEFCHVRKSTLFVCWRSVLAKIYVTVSNLCLDAAEFILL